jgi:hypothetical protein
MTSTPLHSTETLSSSESSTSSSDDDNEMLVGKDTDDKIKTPFSLPAECSDPLLQGPQSKIRGGCHYGSPLACGCIPSKFADWPVTCQARTLQRCKFNESLLSSNGPGRTMSLTLRRMQMRTPLATRMVRKDRPLILLFVPLLYSTRTVIPVPLQWKGTRFLSLTGSSRDPTTSLYSPILLHATLRGIRIIIFHLHTGRTPDCWITLHHPFDWMTGVTLNLTMEIRLPFHPQGRLNTLWGAGLRLDPRKGMANC